MSKGGRIKSKNVVSWIDLPELVLCTLSQYFNRNDVIKLSKVCKSYRNHLLIQALRTITIPSFEDYAIFNIDIGLFNTENIYEFIINSLRNDFKGKYHLVKELIFKIDFPDNFSTEIFPLFPRITNLKILEYQEYSFNKLIDILSSSNCLDSIALKLRFPEFYILDDSVYYNFFYQLKSINLRVHRFMVDLELPFDVIDSNFSNLKSLSVVNQHMLTKLSGGLQSLKYVEFLGEYVFDKAILSTFFYNNSQIRKISISTGCFDKNVVNSILSLENLEHLELTSDMSFNDIDFSIMPENYSIKHITFKGICCKPDSISMIKLCRNLQTYEAVSMICIIKYTKVINTKFPDINTLILSKAINVTGVKSFLKTVTKFDRVMFRNGFKLSELYKDLFVLERFGWYLKQDYSKGTNEFTLVRKSN
ncbi:hypothetical protein CONCODRAFT_69226 [Conidiobolus coronatus NRRL 28638]|uniref:F-box domain-containing protein n=1 Tax=Conidiobolus coronatus (strain ATCC 28846 / CBS 209.66 / NRRL 28638) TaxID=796925 RepID=A0A137PB06_CONC2|nr:hypothetical protein CONCODRAFT_69226 [Conidiobolus coronatus NRRL 28638]|eukprot:KXN72179.1 hypothetical protein CONCODRAFT_69226 [Conidiobolus coronatus NRRL 28638]